MANHLSDTEKWLKARLLQTGTALSSAVGQKIYNFSASPKAVLPYLVFRLIPLDPVTGQNGTVLQSRFIADVQIYCQSAQISQTDTAVAAISAFFETDDLTRTQGTSRIDVAESIPISREVSTKFPDNIILARGISFKLYVSTI